MNGAQEFLIMERILKKGFKQGGTAGE